MPNSAAPFFTAPQFRVGNSCNICHKCPQYHQNRFLQRTYQLLQQVRTSTQSCVSETRTNEVESHHSRQSPNRIVTVSQGSYLGYSGKL